MAGTAPGSVKQPISRVRKISGSSNLLFPQLLILGGGISRNPEKWVPLLNTRTPVRVAQLNEDAGIIGAALAAHEAEATTSLTTHAVHSSILQPQT